MLLLKVFTAPFVWLWNQFYPSPEYSARIHQNFNIACVCDELVDQIRWSRGRPGVKQFWFHTRIDDAGKHAAIEKLRQKGYSVTLIGSNMVEFTPA